MTYSKKMSNYIIIIYLFGIFFKFNIVSKKYYIKIENEFTGKKGFKINYNITLILYIFKNIL